MNWLASAFLVAALGVVGCGGSSASGAGGGGGAPPGCNADPWSCPGGQTCAISNEGKTFTCLNSGAGKIGETCKNIIDQPQCSDGLTCFQLQGDTNGTCSPYCDSSNAAHACPNSATCVSVQVGSAGVVHICQPDGAGGAGGMGSTASTATGTGGAGGAGGSGGAGEK